MGAASLVSCRGTLPFGVTDAEPFSHGVASGDPAADRVILWSGSLGTGLFEPDPHTWMPAGRAALDGVCSELAVRLAVRRALFQSSAAFRSRFCASLRGSPASRAP